MREEKVSKWLGQYLSSGGLAESVAETVNNRDGKIRGPCLEQLAMGWPGLGGGADLQAAKY